MGLVDQPTQPAQQVGTKRSTRVPLTPRQKAAAIKRVTNGESKASVARELGVPESTLRGWCKSEEKILTSIRNNSGQSSSSPPYSSESNASTNGTDDLNNDVNPSKRRRIDQTPEDVENATATDPAANLQNFQNILAAGCSTNVTGATAQTSSFNYNAVDPTAYSTVVLASLWATYANMQTFNNSSSTVNFVDNGLQYRTMATNGVATGAGSSNLMNTLYNMNDYRKNMTQTVASTQMPSMHSSGVVSLASLSSTSLTRESSRQQSISPAAEPPSTLIPAHPGNSKNNFARARNGTRKNESAVLTANKVVFSNNLRKVWEENAASPQSEDENEDKSSLHNSKHFWTYVKKFGCPINGKVSPPKGTSGSPKQERRAVLDEILINNKENNDNKETCQAVNNKIGKKNTDDSSENRPNGEVTYDEAIASGEKLLHWMRNVSTSNLTQIEVLQFQALMKKLNEAKETSSAEKQNKEIAN